MNKEKSGDKTIHVFLSYSHIDREIAGEIKKQLEIHGFKVFLAHEDIEPNTEWEGEILRKLKECDLFIPIISKNFKESEWTDQETGIAIGAEKEIIPTQIDLAPYGFIGKIQALKLGDEIPSACDKIIDTIRKSTLKEKFTDCLIESFIKSTTFAEANRKAKIFIKHEPFTDVQINNIIFGFLTNDQISGGFNAKRIIKKLFEKYNEFIEPELKEKFEEIIK